MTADNDWGKGCGACCGLIIIIFILSAISNNWKTITQNGSGILYIIIFGILLIGILYEGWKAVTK